MKAHATAINASHQNVGQSQHAGSCYTKVFDSRKRRVRGLWERNGSFYAQLTVKDPGTGQKLVRRMRLEDRDGQPVGTVGEAVKVMNRLRVRREEDKLSLEPKRGPAFEEYARSYLGHYELLKDAKRPATLHRERTCLAALNRTLGHLRLRQITRAVVNGHMARRQGEGMSARTVNLELVTLRNVLRKAVDDGFLPALLIEGVKWLPYHPEKRRLLSLPEIEGLCTKALEVSQNGTEFADFVKLMAFSGGRWGETLRLRWSDVDFELGQLQFGSDGLTKNHEARAVDFNTRLRAHLKEMQSRRAPDSQFLFPSPQRGAEDKAAQSFNMTLRKARVAAGLPDFTCHLCRHFFVSSCVMAGIDFMTIARWVGHKDGGVLIGKVYGHLSNEHAQRQAARLEF
jgi:integrase